MSHRKHPHCNHLRTNSARKTNGYSRECLACGFIWFEKDKPKTEAELADRVRFEHNEILERNRK